MCEFPFQELVYATRWYYRTSGTGGMAFLALQIYRRPMEMIYAVLRLAMLLAGACEETCDLEGLSMHYYRIGRSGPLLILIHGLGSSAEINDARF